jgi:signal transduction histidine kinase
MQGDHLLFLAIAAVLIISAINTLVLIREHGSRQGETFWLWGLIALAVSYLGFGSSAWLGRPALVLGNSGLMIAYLAMSLQLRYWQTGKTNGLIWAGLGVVLYSFVLEYLRVNEPYLVRSLLIHITMSIITAYLVIATIGYYRKNGSKQLLLLTATFIIEFLCTFSRLLINIVQPELINQQMTLYEEPIVLVVFRWVWLVANAMSFLTVMAFELEKTLNKNETLGALLKEKGLLLDALSRLDRSDKSAAIGRSLSHELRQPLTTILLASKHLQAQIKDNDYANVAETVDFLCHECERSTNLVNQLDAVFRPKRTHTQATRIGDCLQQAIELLKPRLLASNTTVHLSGNLDCVIAGEPIQIETIFINLISNSINALTHCSRPRHIDIQAKHTDLDCMVTVTDNGPGIDPAVLANIWQPYVSNEEAGSGLGLWLSQQIASNHCGKIEAGSHSEEGAWFCVTLPRPQVST